MSKSALIVIDAQNIYLDAASELACRDAHEVVVRINKIIERFEERREPIVLVRHIHAQDGSDLGRMFDFSGPAEDFNFKRGSRDVEYISSLARPASAKEIIKTRYSAFKSTELENYLRRCEVDRVVIVGFMTSFCCSSTAREAHDLDFFVTFVSDATGSPDLAGMRQEEVRQAVSTMLGAGYALITNTSEFLGA